MLSGVMVWRMNSDPEVDFVLLSGVVEWRSVQR